MLTKAFVLAAGLAWASAASASAPPAPDVDPTLINHPPEHIQVVERKLQSAPAVLRDSRP